MRLFYWFLCVLTAIMEALLIKGDAGSICAALFICTSLLILAGGEK